MSNVTLTIGGRSYAVACAAGEEGHIAKLGQMIDAKLATMGDAVGHNEVRTLLFASLLLADELHEARANPAEGTEDILPLLEKLAEQAENLASDLERRTTTP